MNGKLYENACVALRFATAKLDDGTVLRFPGPNSMTVESLIDAIDVAFSDTLTRVLAAPCVTVDGLTAGARLKEMRNHLLGCERGEPVPSSHAFAAIRAAAELQALGVL